MPHGTPDYGISAPKKTVYALPDLAELAARLGSPVIHDRRGDVIYMTDFRDGVEAWVLDGDGDDNNQEWSSEHPRNSGFSLKHTTGKDDLCQSYQQIYLPYAVPSGIGFEFAFNLGVNITDFQLWMIVTTGALYYTIKVVYTISTSTFQYVNSVGAMVDLIPVLPIIASPNHNHVVKVVVDISTGKYMRLICDNVTYDLSEYSLYSTESETQPYIRPEIRFTGLISANRNAWVNHCIVTQNEE